MAITFTNGTQLERSPLARPPLNRKFLVAMVALYLVAVHLFSPHFLATGTGLSLLFNNAVWLVFGVVLGIGLYQIARNRYFRYNKLTLGLSASCVLLLIPSFYGDANFYSLTPRMIGLLLGLLLFVLLQQFLFSNKQKQRLLWLVLIAALIEAVIGYGQYLIITPIDANTAVRPEGAFQHPNTMSSMLATGFIISGYLLARLSHKYNRKAASAITLYLTPVIIIPLIVIIASRTGWLSAAMGGVMLIPYLYRHSTRKRFRGWVFSTLCGLAIGLLIGLSNAGSQNLITTKTQVNDFRTTLYPQALDMFIEKPLTGYGLGQFESEYVVYSARQHHLNPQYPAALEGVSHPHNEVLLWGIEGGIIPILGLLLAAGLVLTRIYYAKKQTRLAILALILPIFLHAMLEQPFYHSMIHWITFIVLLYWIDQRTPRSSRINISRVTTHSVRAFAFIVPTMLVVAVSTHLYGQYRIDQYKQQEIDATALIDSNNPLLNLNGNYMYAVNHAKLDLGLSEQNSQRIIDYINWASKAIARQPKPELYQGLLNAYQSQNAYSQMRQVESEAYYLFPNHVFSVKGSQAGSVLKPE
ncbi:PglL family O-oligosaccharyltransferase [Vibrio hippocampi]|uniref:Ligase n=1 Tax=Vibrio hippocampi TaxID=654686 RepID=A0ABN8DKY0_9VIBR|nr:PglL family O-oligosaccharyltransferase [Vibrio hippocampi]CAH0526886.1 hypothetical protein VHP8226_02262 [Vibrio hippocampi]